jgi:hypothetical protein
MAALPLLRRRQLILACLILSSEANAADSRWPMPITAHATVGQQSIDFFVRFDAPVNHTLSSFAVIHGSKVVAVLHPRLDAAPNVLFARISTLAAGDYVLRWTVCPAGTDDRHYGEFAFTVGQ